ncbi:MAG: methionyl-tRNA formyltransferase, partial [Candidatus Omnitrophica bacterium]|nr:methionyl-tRNA formyltransferase [Candidatus Omnitrophota bacterium]
MKFVYFGSGYFSRCVLGSLCAKKNVPALVVSQLDKAQGRGMKLAPMEATAFAQESNLPFVTPHSLKNKETIDTIASIKPEIIVVADYGKLLPTEILRIPSIMPLAVHPSLLPRWRGAAPIARAILNGDTTTGIAIFKMNEKLDAGEIISVRKVSIVPGEDVRTLTARMGPEGAQALIEAMDAIAKKQYTLTPQDETKATYAEKFSKEEGRI